MWSEQECGLCNLVECARVRADDVAEGGEECVVEGVEDGVLEAYSQACSPLCVLPFLLGEVMGFREAVSRSCIL